MLGTRVHFPGFFNATGTFLSVTSYVTGQKIEVKEIDNRSSLVGTERRKDKHWG